MANRDLYSVYNLGMANYLCRCGHDIMGVVDNDNDDTGYYKTFLFERSEKLESDLNEYKKITRKNSNRDTSKKNKNQEATEKDDLYIVYSLALMNKIVMAGYGCRQVEDDTNNPKYKVFLFEKRPEVLKIINEFANSKRK